MCRSNFQPNSIFSYFKLEWRVLFAVTISGFIYNIGLLAGPWFEGKLAGCLIDILEHRAAFADMLILVLYYAAAIATVQIARYIKRFYVRRFANNVNRRMKQVLYGNLVRESKASLEEEGTGNLMTKAILDVDDCAEGMRKFTTEIFDTGIALAAYIGMLLYYDWRLALLGMIFPPISYLIAEKMKVIVQRTGARYKEQSGNLSAATLDRASNAITYRVFGREQNRRLAYEQELSAYETAAVSANIWGTALPPLYRVVSMTGVLFILYFGSKNVLGTGWKTWDIAVFTTFLSCFTKLSVKSSSAAKLFNAVHKAQVSWKRIKPLMNSVKKETPCEVLPKGELTVEHLSFAYPGGPEILCDISFHAAAGQIIGVTGPVACGKSTLGKTFLCEYPYRGTIRFNGDDLQAMDATRRSGIIGYLGHDPELFNDTIQNNILLSSEGNAEKVSCEKYLKLVCLDKEVSAMEQGVDTLVGNGGVRLSGGQAQRLALSRTICHKRPLLILDDPFSALDRTTEEQIFHNLREIGKDSIILLISHRLYLFPEMDQIIWMDNGRTTIGSHEALLQQVPAYAALYEEQGGISHES